MEGSESEAIFESLNLKPQLFINEVLNSVDNLVDGAFDFFHREASELLKTDGSDRSADLKKGIDHMHLMIQAAFDKRLGMWEKYCLRHCFSVPGGFSLSDPSELIGDFPMEDVLDDELDVQLDSLRNQLAEVADESEELNLRMRMLERQSSLSNSVTSCVKEVLRLYDENHVEHMLQEMIATASELRERMEKLKNKKLDEKERKRRETVCKADDSVCMLNPNKGLFSEKLEDLEAFLADIKNK